MGEISRRRFLKASAAGAGAFALEGSSLPALARVASGHCGWGAFAEPGPGQTPIEATAAMERLIGRKLDVTRHYMSWDRDFPNTQIKESGRTGHIPLISWEAQRRNGTYVKWADIAAGRFDTLLKERAREMKAWGHRAYFVFNHEPENDTNSGNASQFKAAYNHARHVFDSVGARNLRWVCTLMRGTYEGSHGGAGAWIPSGAQALGVDGYNRGRCNADTGWQSFSSIFGPARNYAKNHSKKLVIQEWGCVEPSACGGISGTATKADWIRNAVATIKSWPQVEAVIYTHARADFGGKTFSYRVDTSTGSLRQYGAAGNLAYFS
jgi:TAT (twin-arginine translocation) pathway-exported protein